VNISELFIRRPVMTTIVMCGILLFGVMSYRLLPVSDLPNVDFPTISVEASLPGASPETMATSVALPLEKEFSTIAGIDQMTSSSQLGSTAITIQFALDRNIDAAAQDVQAAIARANRQLPQNMPYPPTYRKSNPADDPILYISLTSPLIPLYALDEYAQTTIAQRISTLSGVAQVMVFGSQKYAVRVQLDPHELTTRRIGIDEVVQAVQAANVNLPTGVLWGPERSYTVQADGQLTTAAVYRPIIVSYRDGKPVRLNELGRVLDNVENNRTASWFVDQRSIMLAIQRQPGTNTVEVAQRIKQLLPSLQEQLPVSVALRILIDRSESIRESVNDVQITLLVTLALVVMVIFIFLRNLSATVIPSLAMPMSIVGTFVGMYLLGYSLDNLSLMAITLSVGFVVDDAIVMLENIVRHMEMGKRPLEAAFAGSKEIGFTILSMTISLASVFIPVLFMGGIVGRLFQEFAVVIGLAVLISGFVSLSLTPVLCSRFLAPPREVQHHALYNAFERFFDSLLATYKKGLDWSLEHPRLTIAYTMALTAATAGLFALVPRGFVPNEDTGILRGQTEAQEGTSFDAMVAHQKELAEIVKNDPGIEYFNFSVGGRGTVNTGNFFIRLKPRAERDGAEQILERLRPQLARVAGIQSFIQLPPTINIGGRMARAQYQITLQSGDVAELYGRAPALENRMRQSPLLIDVSSDLRLKNPQLQVMMDRDQASALGITAQQIEEALYSAYGQRQISTIFAPNNQYRVILELLPEYQNDPTDLKRLYVRARSGALVPIESLARLQTNVGPLTVNHSGQVPSVTLSFNLAAKVSLSEATSEVMRLVREMMPDTVSASFQGAAQAFQSSMRGMGLLLILAIVVIYMVLGILYESFIHPLTILSALPLAGLGALLTLLVFRVDLNLYSFIGIVMLVGLVKKNGIIMIDFALETQRKDGKGPRDAIFDACVIRFRPIMMTTMSALFGTLPIALGLGAGAEARRPLGLAVVGGLIVSQSLTLFVTPVVYLYMEELQHLLARRLWFLQARRHEAVES
jgi:hydrophobic/amphiphilic exporter-1 (mainly G- bacteria), HAE1 family